MADTLAGSLRDELLALLAPLASCASPSGLRAMLRSLGHADAMAAQGGLQAAMEQAAALVDELAALDDDALASFEGIARALKAADDTFTVVRGVEQAISDPTLLAQAEGLGVALASRLVALHLRANHARLYRVASLLTLVGPAEVAPASPLVVENGQIVRFPSRDDRFQFDRLGALMKEPFATLRDAYFPNDLAHVADAYAAADRLLPLIGLVASELSLRSSRDLRALDPPSPSTDEPSFGDHFSADPSDTGDPSPGDPLAIRLRRMPRLTALLPGLDGTQRLGVEALVSSAEHEGGVAGLIFALDGALAWTETFGSWKLDFTSDGQVPAFVIGPNGVALAPLDTALTSATGRFSAVLITQPGTPAWRFGSATGTRLELGGAKAAVQFALSPAHCSIALEVAVDKAAIVIAGGDGDGFLGSLVPADGLHAEFDLGLVLSSDTGLALKGGAGLDVMVPVGLSFAGMTLSSVHLGLHALDDHVELEVSGSVSASIGPVIAVLDRIGIEGALTFPSTGGNLGIADFDIGFKGPSGIGLSVDVPGVASGGGFLFHDAPTSTYAGVLQISIYEQLTVTAFGLIATRMPDGSRGYSLVVFITADDFRPIQLGLGFTLLGIGGMVGIHRTFDENVLREGMKNDTLGTLLFPRDPVRNAAAIVSALAKAFPARAGSYLVGLLAKIGWFTPTLVLIELAVIVEFGVRKRLLVLGRVSSLLPSADNDLVRINVDVVGVIDFDQGSAAVDGMLVDSRLAQAYALSGAMALRANWGSGPGSTFVLAVGGLHPRFSPPSDLPKLARIAIAFSSGNNPRLTCEAYFAITANTVQFGSRAQLYAAAYGFSIEGDIGYDVLIEIAPLHFIADFHAKVALKHGSSNLFSVSVEGELEGPRPLRVSGKASFSIFWCDFTVRFDKTLVEGEKPPAPAGVDLGAQLAQALCDPTSWSVQTRSAHGVALRKLGAGSALVLDPLGTLVVKQQIVPLNTTRDIEVYGGAPVSGARRFELAATLQSQTQEVDAVRGRFAPAQYFALSEEEKLAAPSFEEMDSGIMFGGEGASFDEVVGAPLIYESRVVDTMAQPAERDPSYTMIVNELMVHTRTGAVARSALRRTGPGRFRVAGAPKAAELVGPRFRIVPLDEGEPAPVEVGTQSWSEYRAALAKLNRGAANWQVVPLHELAG